MVRLPPNRHPEALLQHQSEPLDDSAMLRWKVIIFCTRKISRAVLQPAISTPFTASPTLSNCQHLASVMSPYPTVVKVIPEKYRLASRP